MLGGENYAAKPTAAMSSSSPTLVSPTPTKPTSKGRGRAPNTPTVRATFPEVYEGLKCYKRIVGDLRIPQKFVVPRNHPDWPSGLAGLKLGTILQNIRYNKTFTKNETEIRALGIVRKVSVTGSNKNTTSSGSAGNTRGQRNRVSASESDEEVGDEEDEEDGDEMDVEDESSEPVSVDEA
jgi:hypothetical protein